MADFGTKDSFHNKTKYTISKYLYLNAIDTKCPVFIKLSKTEQTFQYLNRSACQKRKLVYNDLNKYI